MLPNLNTLRLSQCAAPTGDFAPLPDDPNASELRCPISLETLEKGMGEVETKRKNDREFVYQAKPNATFRVLLPSTNPNEPKYEWYAAEYLAEHARTQIEQGKWPTSAETRTPLSPWDVLQLLLVYPSKREFGPSEDEKKKKFHMGYTFLIANLMALFKITGYDERKEPVPVPISDPLLKLKVTTFSESTSKAIRFIGRVTDDALDVQERSYAGQLINEMDEFLDHENEDVYDMSISSDKITRVKGDIQIGNFDLNLRSSRGGYSMVHIAVIHHQLELLALAITEGCDLDSQTLELRHTALMIAASNGYHHCVHQLLGGNRLKYKANGTIKCKEGLTALHHAAQNCIVDFRPVRRDYLKVIEYLTQDPKFDPNIRTSDDHKTPLHLFRASCTGIVPRQPMQRLIDAKADLEAKDRYGNTPLHFAMLRVSEMSGQIEMVRFLLEKGAESNAINNALSTPLHFATRIQNDEGEKVVNLLKENGADSELVNKNGRKAGDPPPETSEGRSF